MRRRFNADHGKVAFRAGQTERLIFFRDRIEAAKVRIRRTGVADSLVLVFAVLRVDVHGFAAADLVVDRRSACGNVDPVAALTGDDIRIVRGTGTFQRFRLKRDHKREGKALRLVTCSVKNEVIRHTRFHFKLEQIAFKRLRRRIGVADQTAARCIEGIVARIRRGEGDKEVAARRRDVVLADHKFVLIAGRTEGRICNNGELDIDRVGRVGHSRPVDDLEHEAVLAVKHLERSRDDVIVVLTERHAVDRDIHAALAERCKQDIPAAEPFKEDVGLRIDLKRMTVHACLGDDVRICLGPLAFFEALDLCIVVVQEEVPAVAFDRLRIRIVGIDGIARSVLIALKELCHLLGERNDAVAVDDIGVVLHERRVVVIDPSPLLFIEYCGMKQLVAVRLDVDEVSAVEEEAARAREFDNNDGTFRGAEVIIAVIGKDELCRRLGINFHKDAVLLTVLLVRRLLCMDVAAVDTAGNGICVARSFDNELDGDGIAASRHLDGEGLEGRVDVCGILFVDLEIEGIHILVFVNNGIPEGIVAAVVSTILGDGTVAALDIDAVLAFRRGLEGVEHFIPARRIDIVLIRTRQEVHIDLLGDGKPVFIDRTAVEIDRSAGTEVAAARREGDGLVRIIGVDGLARIEVTFGSGHADRKALFGNFRACGKGDRRFTLRIARRDHGVFADHDSERSPCNGFAVAVHDLKGVGDDFDLLAERHDKGIRIDARRRRDLIVRCIGVLRGDRRPVRDLDVIGHPLFGPADLGNAVLVGRDGEKAQIVRIAHLDLDAGHRIAFRVFNRYAVNAFDGRFGFFAVIGLLVRWRTSCKDRAEQRNAEQHTHKQCRSKSFAHKLPPNFFSLPARRREDHHSSKNVLQTVGRI